MPSAKNAPSRLDSIPVSEFAERRSRVLKALGESASLVFAGEGDPSLHHPFRPHPHFEYLTGIVDEPGAILLLDPTNPLPDARATLFLRPLNPELEKWDGFRDTIGAKLRERYGFKTIFRTNRFALTMQAAAKRAKRFACLHPFAFHNAPVSPDLEIYRKIAERMPGIAIEDRTELLAEMRARKSPVELASMRQAIDITARGYEAALKTIRPGLTEFDVQEAIEHAYRTNGARGTAYRTIAGTGFNATVLHYHANDQPLADGDLICIDSGSEYLGYASDITRTFPANGKFTPRQKEIYEIVLKAELAAIAVAKAGATFAQIDKAARDIIVKAGFGDSFIHGIGHHLGLEVHDITPAGPLPEGAVITIEPGIYLPDERIGIRIEDDILIGTGTSTVLSAMIPKTVTEIEKAMRG
jgi:Xaa-Pro aminopeptidase